MTTTEELAAVDDHLGIPEDERGELPDPEKNTPSPPSEEDEWGDPEKNTPSPPSEPCPARNRREEIMVEVQRLMQDRMKLASITPESERDEIMSAVFSLEVLSQMTSLRLPAGLVWHIRADAARCIAGNIAEIEAATRQAREAQAAGVEIARRAMGARR